MVYSTGEGSTCSATTGMPCSTIVGFAVYSTIGCSDLAVCFVVFSIVGCFGCSGLGDIGMVMVWADKEENLLKYSF